MAGFRLTRPAEGDIHDIAIFSRDRWGLTQALNYLDGLDQCLNLLANTPDSGVLRKEFARDLRSFRFRSHNIYYRLAEDGVIDVVRVLHHARDAERIFSRFAP